MNGVYVFSKNTAVRNAPWWDKLYIHRAASGIFSIAIKDLEVSLGT